MEHSLTSNQLHGAIALAQGQNQNQAAKAVGVSRRTIVRWLERDDFRAEVEKRKQAAAAIAHQKADEQQKEETDNFFASLKEYREAREQVYKTMLSRGLKGLQKVDRRFNDLPDEAITPQSIAPLLSTFSDIAEKALEGWAELIGVDELLKRLENDALEKT
jgi:transcriptional regulator with XRE-family HTH domain